MRISDWSSDVCSSDLFGGGSGLDCAKAIALMVGQKRPMWDFEDVGDNWKLVDPAGVAPIIAVPTTAGTGSEVGRAAEIGRASCRERVGQYVEISVVVVFLKNKEINNPRGKR